MNQFFVINTRRLGKLLLLSFVIIAAYVWFSFQVKVIPAFSANEEAREIHMVTSEFATKTEDGKEIEIYRFDPGTIYIKKGEKVNLKIFGVNGHEHAFTIEGTNIQGTVEKGKETIVPLQINQSGTYRLICSTHHNYQSGGPMIAYIVVD